MKLRFSRLIHSEFHALGKLVLAVAVFLPAIVHAQDAANPTLAPAAPKPHHAYIRFWNMLPKNPVNNLMLLSNEKDAISSIPPGNVFADYLQAPVGNYSLIVRRLSDTSGALQRLPVAMPDGTFITLIAVEKNGQPTVEIFNDTPDPKIVETGGRIVMRQFFPGAHVTASVVGAGPSSKPLDYGDTAVLENVPFNAQVSINLQAVLPTTPPSTRSWNLTGDFSVAHHATLLLVADSYGRFRPRLSMDAFPPPQGR